MAVSVEEVTKAEARELQRRRSERIRARRRKARENDSFLMFLARMFAAWALVFATISLPVLFAALYRAVGA